jgi:hypothetical protein|tara:strand:- start:12266 stop:12718 length:453 start_codon:yes stop_codon:yes gene_type:complete
VKEKYNALKLRLSKVPGLYWLTSMSDMAILLGMVVALFVLLVPIIRFFAPTAGVFDVGLLMSPAIGMVACVASMIMIFVVWRFGYGKPFDRWFDGNTKKKDKDTGKIIDPPLPTLLSDFNSTTPTGRLFFFLGNVIAVAFVVGIFALVFA